MRRCLPVLQTLIKWLLQTSIVILGLVVEENLLTMALNSCIPLIQYMDKFQVLQKRFLERCLKLVVHDKESVRYNIVSRARRVCMPAKEGATRFFLQEDMVTLLLGLFLDCGPFSQNH